MSENIFLNSLKIDSGRNDLNSLFIEPHPKGHSCKPKESEKSFIGEAPVDDLQSGCRFGGTNYTNRKQTSLMQ